MKLCARARAGDPRAFAELYDTFAQELFCAVLLPRLGSRAAAEDALAETFRAAFASIGTFAHEGKSVWFWLHRIAVNKALDTARAHRRAEKTLFDFAATMEDAGTPDLDAAIDAPKLRARIERTLGAVNERYRRAIELRFFEERSREACAEALAVSVATFDVVLLRALKAFKKEWHDGA